MKCKSCGVELSDNTKYCPNCGIEIIEASTKEKLVGSNVDDVEDIINLDKVLPMSLFKRFIGTIIDKFLILFLFVAIYIFFNPFTAGGELGRFTGFLEASPVLYNYMPDGDESKRLDLHITIMFVILNLLYYAFFEYCLKASLGKRILGGLLISPKGRVLNSFGVIKRMIVGFTMMLMAIWVHINLNISNLNIIALYFFILDIPVFFKRQSLIDILTKTIYIKKNSIQKIPKSAIKCGSVLFDRDKWNKKKRSTFSALKSKFKPIKLMDDIRKGKHNKLNIKYHLASVGFWLTLIVLIFLLTCSLYVLNTENDKRLKIKNRLTRLTYLSDGDFYIEKACTYLFNSQVIGDGILNDRHQLLQPKGMLIAGYGGEGEDSYDTYEPYIYYSDEPIYGKIPYSRWSYGVVGYKKVPYKAYRTICHPYKYNYWLLVYDISNSKATDDELLEEYESFLDLNNYTFEVSKQVQNANVSYRINDNTFETVFFANHKAYVLDVISSHDAGKHASKILSAIVTKRLNRDLMWHQCKMLCPLILFIICVCLIVATFLKQIMSFKKVRKNKIAYGISIYCILCLVANLTLVLMQWVYVYNGTLKSEWFLYFLLFFCTLLINLMSINYFFNRIKLGDTIKILIPKFLKRYLHCRVENNVELKSLVAFVLYPFWILIQLPFGPIVLLYIIPLSLLILIGMECRHLYQWLNKNERQASKQANKGNGVFVDYYLVLDLSNDASFADIDQAFNHKVAQYNSSTDRNLYNKYFWQNIQEAYRVLSSKRLRPAYDKEYEIYDSQELTEIYSFKDRKLERDIMLVRESLGFSTKKSSDMDANVVIISLIIWVVLVIVFLSVFFAE